MSTAVVYTCDCCKVPFDGATSGRLHLSVAHYFTDMVRVLGLDTGGPTYAPQPAQEHLDFCSYDCLRSYDWEKKGEKK
jgi:hypothetical protein